jgi:hypothetical protein
MLRKTKLQSHVHEAYLRDSVKGPQNALHSCCRRAALATVLHHTRRPCAIRAAQQATDTTQSALFSAEQELSSEYGRQPVGRSVVPADVDTVKQTSRALLDWPEICTCATVHSTNIQLLVFSHASGCMLCTSCAVGPLRQRRHLHTSKTCCNSQAWCAS